MEPISRTDDAASVCEPACGRRKWSARRSSASTRSGIDEAHASNSFRLPVLLTVDEAAEFLRTTRRAIYAMVERRQLPGVIRIRRRVLLRADDLLHWLDQKRASSPKE